MNIDLLLDTLLMVMSTTDSELGMLFIASEFGNHIIYIFLRIVLTNSHSMSRDALSVSIPSMSTIEKEDESDGHNQHQ
jgi:hypothetical protein